MRRRTFSVAKGDVLHVDVPGKGRHVGIVIDVAADGAVLFAVATSGNWKTQPLRREIDFSAEPARSWITDWPRDNGERSYFYGGFIDVYPPDRWIRAVGHVPRPAVEALLDLWFEWDCRRRGAPIPAGPTTIPP